VTLVEIVVVLAMLGVIAALAVPNLLPLLSVGRLDGAALEVAAFVEDTRVAAAVEGRCHRVRVVNGREIVDDRRTGGDCINLGSEGWSEVRRLPLEPGSTMTLASTTNAPVSPDEHRIVFRASSRLWGDGDLDVTDDHAQVVVRVPDASVGSRTVEITAAGRICVRSHGGAAPPVAVLTCP
jgi:Tfp pilus assembly protein FimT